MRRGSFGLIRKVAPDRTQRVDQVRRRDARDDFFDAVAVAVVDNGHSALLDEVVLEVVDVADATGADGVAVCVVGVAGGEAVVGVVVPQAGGNGRERRGHLLAIADGVVNVINRANDAVRIAGDGLAGEAVEIVVAVYSSAT